jgi:deoxyribodipyrimidine photo-lyase
MTAHRRTRFNFALERAVERARELRRPLIILEALRLDYPWSSPRLHRFVLDGMADNRDALQRRPVTYYPYVEPEPGAGKGLLHALGRQACVVITDDYPCFFLPQMLRTAASRLPVHVESVDSNGLLPMAAGDRIFKTAQSFRRHLQKTLPEWLDAMPRRDPLRRARLPNADPIDAAIRSRWPPASGELLDGQGVNGLPLSHDVAPVPYRGGSRAGRRRLRAFLDAGLSHYASGQRHPDSGASSGLSPWLHFGHVAAHEVFDELTADAGWTPDDLAPEATGKRTGWWNLDENAEAFLDELITWRELGFNTCFHRDDYAEYDSLPDWAQQTLAEHARDRRPHLYDLEQLEQARTADPVWNAAQRQLLQEGTIHNYLRMLWGKKILEWTRSPRQAAEFMIILNDKYAVDGRDPNSYSGIYWILGRYDRPWGPEREIFGKIRYMSSDATRRKLKMTRYLERYGDD